MVGKYDAINPRDESIREFFNRVDEIAINAGLATRIADNSSDSLLEILQDGESICIVDGMSANLLHNPYPVIYALMDDIAKARMEIPFISNPEAETLRMAALEQMNDSWLEMTL